MKEFWFLAFEGVADELEHPSRNEKDGGIEPEPVQEDASQEKYERQKNGRNAQGMAGTVDGMLMAGRVLRDPLFAGASAQHAGDDTPGGGSWLRIHASELR